MSTLFSLENQITRRMDQLGLTADFLSALAQIPASRLSGAFRGVRPLESQQGLALIALLDKLDRLVAQAGPLPVSFKNPIAIRDLLTALDDGRVRIAVEIEAEQ
jgi:hypothetical protein